MSDGLRCGNCGAPVQVPAGAAPNAPFTCPFCGAQVEPASTSVDPSQLARIQHELELMKRQISAESSPEVSHYVSGEADVENAPLDDWERAAQPPSLRSILKVIVIGGIIILVLAAFARILGLPWL